MADRFGRSRIQLRGNNVVEIDPSCDRSVEIKQPGTRASDIRGNRTESGRGAESVPSAVLALHALDQPEQGGSGGVDEGRLPDEVSWLVGQLFGAMGCHLVGRGGQQVPPDRMPGNEVGVKQG